MAGWGSGPWGSSPWGTGDEDTESFANVDVEAVNIIAEDMIQIIFSEPMKNNAALQNPASYTVTPFDPSKGVTVEVREVRTGSGFSATFVLLVVTPPTIGAVYDVEVVGDAVSLNDVGLAVTRLRTIMRRTKIDSFFKTRPTMYDLRPESVIRNLLTALGREDDLIGGSQLEGEDIFR